MKTYKDYLIDFDSLKVGEKAWSIELGDCEVVLISSYGVYPVEVASLKNKDRRHKYTKDGFRCCTDFFPSLFKEKPDFFKEKKEVKKYKWYYELELVGVVSTLDGTTTTSKTEDEFIKWFKEQYPNSILMNYEKIDCTEIVVVVYE